VIDEDEKSKLLDRMLEQQEQIFKLMDSINKKLKESEENDDNGTAEGNSRSL